MIANAGGDATTLQRLGPWNLFKVAELYVEQALTSKKKTADLIDSRINFDESDDLATPLNKNNSRIDPFADATNKRKFIKNETPISETLSPSRNKFGNDQPTATQSN